MKEFMELAERLRQSRKKAGYKSAAEAATSFGWTTSTYAAHENGNRGLKLNDIQKYAIAFRVDPAFLAFGEQRQTSGSGIAESTLRVVIPFVLKHEGAQNAPPDILVNLIIDLCHYTTKSGEAGMGNIVDFAFARLAARG